MFVLAVLTVAGWKGDDRRVEAAMPRESQASVDTGQVRKTTLREIANYPVLREQARNAAKEQVGMLTAVFCEEGADVRIVFKNEGE